MKLSREYRNIVLNVKFIVAIYVKYLINIDGVRKLFVILQKIRQITTTY